MSNRRREYGDNTIEIKKYVAISNSMNYDDFVTDLGEYRFLHSDDQVNWSYIGTGRISNIDEVDFSNIFTSIVLDDHTIRLFAKAGYNVDIDLTTMTATRTSRDDSNSTTIYGRIGESILAELGDYNYSYRRYNIRIIDESRNIISTLSSQNYYTPTKSVQSDTDFYILMDYYNYSSTRHPELFKFNTNEFLGSVSVGDYRTQAINYDVVYVKSLDKIAIIYGYTVKLYDTDLNLVESFDTSSAGSFGSGKNTGWYEIGEGKIAMSLMNGNLFEVNLNTGQATLNSMIAPPNFSDTSVYLGTISNNMTNPTFYNNHQINNYNNTSQIDGVLHFNPSYETIDYTDRTVFSSLDGGYTWFNPVNVSGGSEPFYTTKFFKMHD